MEQLVHLRLKSIYKAFKQSSVRAASNVRDRQNDDPDECHVADDPEALLQAAASAAKNSQKSKRSSSHAGHDSSTAEKSSTVAAATIEQYKAEQKKADDAAAALLAELDEEEEAAKSKKSKKKKKKKKLQSKGEEDEEEEKKKPDEASGEGDGDNDEEDDMFFGTDDRKKPPNSKMNEGDAMDIDATKDEDDDPLEEELNELIDDEDVEGIEELLSSVKGVPGRASLRKNAKKALKKFRLLEKEEEEAREKSEAAKRAKHEATAADSSKGARSQSPIDDSNGAASLINTENGPSSDVLKIVSYSHNVKQITTSSGKRGLSHLSGGSGGSGNKSEAVLHMAPHIVGWVIGKGGQRIRDLMEESGARIWIDQDSVGPVDLRVVYISGVRKNVDFAMRRITELVSKAPAAVTSSKQSTPSGNDHSGGAAKHSGGKGGPAPSIPDSERMSSSEKVGIKPRGEKKSEHILTCDSRFVPLLIGRRGWTIKNIQDSSGARVDIDQTVTPRKITISGREENVKSAVRMVNDVLSYPHAELKGNPDDEAVSPSPIAASPAAAKQHSKKQNQKQEASKQEKRKQQQTQQPQKQKDKLEGASPQQFDKHGKRIPPHSPPSSLIMTGDAKSTISASSSLSSTPEPAMASSKVNVQVPPGPMLPPAIGLPPYSQSPADPVGPQAQLQHNGSIFSPGGGLVVPPQPTTPQHAPLQDNSLFGPGTPQPHQAAPSVRHSTPPIGPSPGIAVGPHRHQQQFSMGLPVDAGMHRPIAGGLVAGGSPIGGTTNQFPVHHQPVGAFHQAQSAASPGGFPIQQNAGLPPVQPSSLRSDESNLGNRGLPNPTFWNGTGVHPSHPGQGQSGPQHSADGFRLDAAVEFLQHSHPKPHRAASMPGGVNDVIGLPTSPPAVAAAVNNKPAIGIHRATSVPVSNLGGDDSRMIDSLFGPPSNATPNDSSLLTGLQGLSIGKQDLSAGSGLWGSAAVGGDELKGLHLGGVGDPAPTANAPGASSHLFQSAGSAAAPVNHHQQNQNQSRFGWGTQS